MKNLFLFFLTIASSIVYSQSNNFPTPNGFVRINGTASTTNHYLTIEGDENDQILDERIRLFSAGQFFPSHSERNFNFSSNPYSNWNSVIFNMRMLDTGHEFLNISTFNNSTRITLKTYLGQESFKVAHDPHNPNTVAENFIHMPRPNSRIVIGNSGNYLVNEGHKLVVSNGDALIEGNTNIDGNVMIGTDSDFDSNLQETFRLSVDGNVRADKIRVYTAWADYVFEDDYELMPLEDLEIFIKDNKHLPNVPSEAKVINEGIDVGDTNRVLLEKVEELTLYIIELNKKIKVLQEENSNSDCGACTQTEK